MSDIYLPEVHSSGLWKLRTPFNNFLLSDVWYTCIAVRKFEDFEKRGIDVYKEFYQKDFSINEPKYKEDLSAGGCIITVRNAAGDVRSFPSSYLESFPSGGGIAYHALAVVCDLGALPVNKDISYTLSQIQNVIKDTLGVEVTAKLINLAPKELLDRESHERIEKERANKVKAAQTPTAEVLKLRADLAKVKRDLQDAEAWIIAKSKTP